MRSDTKKISGNHKIYLHTFIEKNERRMKKKGKKKKKEWKRKTGGTLWPGKDPIKDP